MIFLDTETAGLTGPVVLIQWAEGDGPIHLHHVWTEPVRSTLDLIERLYSQPVCAWNATFDLFHLYKAWDILSRVADKSRPPAPSEVADLERPSCTKILRPAAILDLWLHAIRGPLQSLMERESIRVRRIPEIAAEPLIDILNARLEFPDIYFARRKDSSVRWKALPRDGEPGWVDVVLTFAPSTALKPVAAHILGHDPTDMPAPAELMPEDERGWRPYGADWLERLPGLVRFWEQNETARRYAEDDVRLLRDLWRHFGCPEPGDTDSELTGCVAATRWAGMAFDPQAAERLRSRIEADAAAVPTAPAAVLAEIKRQLGPLKGAAVRSTDKRVLKMLAGQGLQYAQQVLDARTATKRIELLDKLIGAGRFHPSLKVVGTLSGRMSGADGLNPQGIPSEPEFRSLFPLADGLYGLSGGDFSGFEVSIAAAVWPDPALEDALRSGRKFHALFGASMYGQTYDEVRADREMYAKAKAGAFASFYGAQAPKLATTLGLELAEAERGLARFGQDFPRMAEARFQVVESFAALTQPGGIGTKVLYREPAEYVETILGRRRYFTLENQIILALYELAQEPPRIAGRVKRRDRVQTISGALSSALYAAAFAVQGANQRAAANHQIQAAGADICKAVQRAVWESNVAGRPGPFVTRALQIHDELLCPTLAPDRLRSITSAEVNKYRQYIPLLDLEWKSGCKNWGGVK